MALKPPRLLDYVPIPLLNDLVSGRWLPVVGAGLSRNAEIRGTGSMPDWRELGNRVGEQLPPGYAADSPLETLSAYQHAYGRGKLIEAIQRELHVTDAHPGPLHNAFCNLPFKVVVTTNVEQLLEQGYRKRYGSVFPITEEEQLRLINPYPSPKLVKLHGDLLYPSSLVLTESDYDRFLNQHPLFATWLANQLISNTCVLIGYSLDDPDFRSIITQLHSRLGAIPPDLYVLEVDADPVRIDRYARRGVRTVNVQSDGRGWAILEELFSELADYWAEHVPTGVTSTTTVGRMVVRARTRLSRVILFLVNTSHLSDYNENVFLDLTEQGLLPVTEEDIHQSEGNDLASLDLLLDAANQVVVEVDLATDPRLDYALRRVGENRVIAILPSRDTTEQGRAEASDRPWVLHGPSENRDWKAFSAQLVDMLRQQRELLQDVRQTAAHIRELLDSGRYQTAFLVGVVELEGRLNRALGLDDYYSKSGIPIKKFSRDLPRSLRGLLAQASQAELISITSREIDILTDGRNRIVHGRELPSDTLQSLTELVLHLLNQLPEQ
jgi:hypothetical protein